MPSHVPPNGLARAIREEDPLPPEDVVTRRRLADELEQVYRSRASDLAGRLNREGASGGEGIDFVHEAFARVLGRSADRRQSIERPEGYVARIARNLLNDHGRSNAVGRKWAEHAATTAAQHHDQVVYLESRDALRRLEAAVMKLRPRTREIFIARRVHGLSYAEIAEATGLSVKTIEKQMSKAIARLSRVMDRG